METTYKVWSGSGIFLAALLLFGMSLVLQFVDHLFNCL